MTLGRHISLPGLGRRVFNAHGTVAAAANWWDVDGVTCIAAYQPKGAASYAASLVNLANSGTYDAAAGEAPSWDTSTGWTFAGAAWLSLGSLPYVALDWTILIRVTAVTFNSGVPFSSYDNAEAAVACFRSYSGLTLDARVGNSGWAAVTSSTSVVFGVAGVTPYDNGTAGTDISGASAKTSVRGAIGASWPGYGPYSPFAGVIAALGIWSSVLSGSQVGTVTTAMAAL